MLGPESGAESKQFSRLDGPRRNPASQTDSHVPSSTASFGQLGLPKPRLHSATSCEPLPKLTDVSPAHSAAILAPAWARERETGSAEEAAAVGKKGDAPG